MFLFFFGAQNLGVAALPCARALQDAIVFWNFLHLFLHPIFLLLHQTLFFFLNTIN